MAAVVSGTIRPIFRSERLAPTRAAIEKWFSEAVAQVDTQWRIQWQKSEWTPPYRTIFTLAWDADGAIDPPKSRFDNHRVLQSEPWPTYFKPPQAVPIDPRGLVGIPRVN